MNFGQIAMATAVLASAASSALAQDAVYARTPWQMHEGDGVLLLDKALEGFGTVDNYDKAKIPLATDKGWAAAPNPEIIGFGGPGKSKIDASKGWKHHCQKAVDYTYFQTFVNVPKGAAMPDVKIAFKGMDDGARISIFNSKYKDGIVDQKGYVKLNQEATEDLKSFMVEGSNRIVITQVDICATDNRLDSAHVTIGGQNVRVALRPELPSRMYLLAYSVNDQVRGAAKAANDHYMGVQAGIGKIFQDTKQRTLFEVVDIDKAAKIVALRVADGADKGKFLQLHDNEAKLGTDQGDKKVQFQVRTPLEPALGSFVSLESVAMPGEFLRHQGFVLKLDKIDMMSSSLDRRDATFSFVKAN